MDLKDKLISTYPSLRNSEPKHIGKLRERAFKNFEAKGFPTKKEETWRLTSLRPVLKENYSLLPATGKKSFQFDDIKPYLVKDLNALNLIFIDGVFMEEFSETSNGAVEVLPLSFAFHEKRFEDAFKENFNQIIPKDNSLCDLNTAFSREGAFIHIKKNKAVERPIQMLHLSTGNEKGNMLQPRNLVVAEENTQVKIIERHQSLTQNPVFTNTVTEIMVNRDSMVDYYKIQDDRLTASLIDNTHLIQKDNSTFTAHTFSFGGKLTRNNLKGTQAGEHINTTFKGVTILEGKQHVDHITHVHHTQPNGESHQDYKGVFDDRSHGVFDGYILVDKIAQKIDGYQKSDNLLLSDRATANAKPQLEIYADDVKCSHGCTVGQMDKDALFYLKSRGIPEKEAKALMMYAFANSVLESVKIPELKKQVNLQIAKKLGVNLGESL